MQRANADISVQDLMEAIKVGRGGDLTSLIEVLKVNPDLAMQLAGKQKKWSVEQKLAIQKFINGTLDLLEAGVVQFTAYFSPPDLPEWNAIPGTGPVPPSTQDLAVYQANATAYTFRMQQIGRMKSSLENMIAGLMLAF